MFHPSPWPPVHLLQVITLPRLYHPVKDEVIETIISYHQDFQDIFEKKLDPDADFVVLGNTMAFEYPFLIFANSPPTQGEEAIFLQGLLLASLAYPEKSFLVSSTQGIQIFRNGHIQLLDEDEPWAVGSEDEPWATGTEGDTEEDTEDDTQEYAQEDAEEAEEEANEEADEEAKPLYTSLASLPFSLHYSKNNALYPREISLYQEQAFQTDKACLFLLPGDTASPSDVVGLGASLLLTPSGQILFQNELLARPVLATSLPDLKVQVARAVAQNSSQKLYQDKVEPFLYAWRGENSENDLLYHYKDLEDGKALMEYLLESYQKLSKSQACKIKSKLEKSEDLEAENLYLLAAAGAGLAQKMDRIHSRTVILGLSAGLDSTLALLIAVEANKFQEKKGRGKNSLRIRPIALPAMGSTDQSMRLAKELCRALDLDLEVLDLTQLSQATQDLLEIDEIHNQIAFENSQARLRTNLLMNLANKYNGIVLGTGDLSEIALGWATYNGDAMSMYNPNASFTKTRIQKIIGAFVHALPSSSLLRAPLTEILGRDISPELLSVDTSGKNPQKTEDIIGKYEIHDYFIEQILGDTPPDSPLSLLLAAKEYFGEKYEWIKLAETLQIFLSRFFRSQFKRDTMPGGGSPFFYAKENLSPRSGLAFPPDLAYQPWQSEIDLIVRALQKNELENQDGQDQTGSQRDSDQTGLGANEEEDHA